MTTDLFLYKDAQAQRQRDAEIFKLRLEGHSLRAIADGYEITSDDVRAALKRMVVGMSPRYRADLVELENERLDSMLQPIMQQAQLGSLDHIETVLKLMDRRAKLLGLDAPVKTSHTSDAEKAPDSGAVSSSDRLLERLHKLRSEGSPIIEGEVVDVTPAA